MKELMLLIRNGKPAAALSALKRRNSRKEPDS
jgi:hypothetical protein